MQPTVRNVLNKTLAYLTLTFVALVMSLPFFWAATTSLKPTGQEFTFPPVWIPDPIVWSNYVRALTILPFGLFFRNTVFITMVALVGQVLTASLAGFAFARLRFPGRDLLFLVTLATLMLPDVVTLVPRFILFRELGWVNTFYPLIVPSWFGGGGFFIFLARQFFMTIPMEYDDAARVDGANEWQIWARVIMPLSRPILTAMGIFSFVSHWNDFMNPLIYLHSMELRTISLGLRTFLGMEGTDWNLLMAASVATTMPIIIVFLLGQRYFIQGVVMSGLGGR